MNVKIRKFGNGITNVIINDPKTYNSLSFKTLRDLCEKNNLKEISMGMSDDYEKAIELGSTNIRIGTKLFGKRN